MNNPTPGPWHVIERANGQAFSIGVQVQTKGNLLTTHYIANVVDMGTPQAEATAHLIAAAPEMYQHLTELCGWLEDEQREDCDAYRQIMALLAKIDGREWREAEE